MKRARKLYTVLWQPIYANAKKYRTSSYRQNFRESIRLAYIMWGSLEEGGSSIFVGILLILYYIVLMGKTIAIASKLIV